MNPRLRELHRALASFGFSRDATTTREIRYEGIIKAGDRDIRSSIIYDDLEFARLPRLELLAAAEDVPELLAHIQSNGEYCYAQRDGFVLDRFNIPQSVAICIELMRRSLERSQTSHAAEEIMAEFPQHWFGSTVYVDIKNLHARQATLYRITHQDGSAFDLLADSERLLQQLTSTRPATSQIVDLVRTKTPLTFATGQKRPETFSEFLDWLSNIDPALSSRALAAAQDTYPAQPLLFIVAPNASIGVRLDFKPAWWRAIQRPQALARYVDKHRHEIKISRLTGERIDPPFIYTRNMNTQPNLSGKSILLVGCGTIGSHLAKMLAQSGAGFGIDGRLNLCDQQYLSAGNIGRHLLGIADVGRPKATAVYRTLLNLYPELTISAVHDDILRRLDSLGDHDLVIDATGDEGVSNALNENLIRRRQLDKHIPTVIFTWLFGNGAAAQALCVTSQKDACYRCLRPDHGGQWRFNPLKSDYATEEVRAQCGEGPFFPYGVAAPITAAALALQLALDWAKGNPSPKLRTQRLELDRTQFVKDQNPAASERCPACGAGH